MSADSGRTRTGEYCCDALVWMIENRHEKSASTVYATRPRRDNGVTTMTASTRARAVVSGCLCGVALSARTPGAATLAAHSAMLLQAIVAAVDAAAAATRDRRSEVAASHHARLGRLALRRLLGRAACVAPLPPAPAMLYVRLATATTRRRTTLVERSAVREWLAGSRTIRDCCPSRGIRRRRDAVMGAGGIAVRGSPPSTGSSDLKLMETGARTRQAGEGGARQDSAGPSSRARPPAARELLPFEDFDLASASVRADWRPASSRARSPRGPATTTLFVAWADPARRSRATTVRVRKTLNLSPRPTVGTDH